jgi:hypothetical protein
VVWCAKRVSILGRPLWLRFTYVTPVLVTKYWGWKRLDRVGTVGMTLGGALYIMLRVVRAAPGVGGSVTHDSGVISAHAD